jgi:hypothetical protein
MKTVLAITRMKGSSNSSFAQLSTTPSSLQIAAQAAEVRPLLQ